MNQRDTDHLRWKSTHTQRDVLFISYKIKLFILLLQPVSIYDNEEKAIHFNFCTVSVICTMHSWLYNICLRMQWPYLTLHYFPLYTCLNPGKTAWKKQPSPFLAARPLMNACLPCGIFLWLLKDKRGTEWAVP